MDFKRSRGEEGGREGEAAQGCFASGTATSHNHTAGHCCPGLQKEPFTARTHQGVLTGRLEKLNLHSFGFCHKKTEAREP